VVNGASQEMDHGWSEGGFPLAGTIPGRVMLLRGYGNAIVPQVAAKFIQAAREALNQLQPITP
jgi:DNA (cytosine-5)-methyltransferase 1